MAEKTNENEYTLADQIAFNEGLQEHIGDLLDAMKPFVALVKETSGRIPTERLSFANWHKLSKAFDAARSAVCIATPPAGAGETPAAPTTQVDAELLARLEEVRDLYYASLKSGAFAPRFIYWHQHGCHRVRD